MSKGVRPRPLRAIVSIREQGGMSTIELECGHKFQTNFRASGMGDQIRCAYCAPPE